VKHVKTGRGLLAVDTLALDVRRFRVSRCMALRSQHRPDRPADFAGSPDKMSVAETSVQ